MIMKHCNPFITSLLVVASAAVALRHNSLMAVEVPDEVRKKIDSLGRTAAKAAVVPTKDGPWLVATASGTASESALPGMQRDSAARAAIVEAKRKIAETIAGEIDTFVSSNLDVHGAKSVRREVNVAVFGQALSRVQLLDNNYDEVAKRCRVVVVIAPAGKTVMDDVVFPDAHAAVSHLLERASQCLCSPGVICAKLQGSTADHPKLAFVSIAIGPQSANGQHEIGNAKAQAALLNFHREQLESLATLKQGQIPDPDDPKGSRLLHYDCLETWARNKAAGDLPPFKADHLDRNGVSYTAIWCVE